MCVCFYINVCTTHDCCSSTHYVHCIDGQNIAKKLAVQILRETKKVKSLLPEYNACQVVIGEENAIHMKEALDLSLLFTIFQPESSPC